jgi:PAS domain S-box-containing protein
MVAEKIPVADEAKRFGKYAKYFPLRRIIYLIITIISFIVLIFVRIHFITPENYNLIHLPLEFFSIAVAVAIFIIAWNTREYAEKSFFLFIGISFLFIGLIDFFHTLVYKGLFVDFSNWATQFWITARYFHAFAFLVSAFMVGRDLKIGRTFLLYITGTAVPFVMIFTGIFPTCYNDTLGALTPFKIISEYVIIAILIGSLVAFYVKRSDFDRPMLIQVIFAIIFTIFSEYSFTLYRDVTGIANLIGHLFKIVSFYFIYLALVQKNLHEPYRTMFRDLKRSEQTLQQQKRDLNQIFNISIPMRIIDTNCNIIQVNNTFCAYFHITREEAVRRKCFDLSQSPYCHTDNCTIKQLQRDVRTFEYEAEFKRETGEIQYFIISASPYYGPDGELLGVLENFTDITERKNAEGARRKSEAEFRRLVETMSDGLAVQNAKGIITYTNRRMTEILGYTSEELLGKNWLELADPKTRKIMTKLLYLRKKGQKSIHDITFQNKFGHELSLLLSGNPIFDADDTYQGSLIVVTDITRLKAAELAIRESEETYRTMFEESPVALKEEDFSEIKTFIDNLKQTGITDFRAYFNSHPEKVEILAGKVKIINANKAYLELYGLEDVSNLTDGLTSIFVEESYDGFRQQLIAFSEGKTFLQAEEVSKNLQGTKNNILLRLHVAPGHETTLTRVLVSIVDLTERIEFENLRRQFVYTVSHELRTPTSVILQAISNLQKYTDQLTEDQETQLMVSLSRNAELLAELIEDLLLVSRLDSEQIQIKWVSYNLPTVLRDVIHQFEPRVTARGIKISHKFGETIELLGDPSRIGQIIRIYLDNAIKYSNDESTIEVTAEDHYHGPYNPSNTDGVLIRIIDEGCGIRKTDLKNLFERFYRSEDVLGIPGTGLGLSIARNLAQLHGGETYAQSTYGEGSIFYVFLPRLAEKPQWKTKNTNYA